MAKFKAEPFYSVHINADKVINFDHVGEYETNDEGEIAVLSGCCPRYLICVDDGKAKVNEPKAEESKAKAPAKKASGK